MYFVQKRYLFVVWKSDGSNFSAKSMFYHAQQQRMVEAEKADGWNLLEFTEHFGNVRIREILFRVDMKGARFCNNQGERYFKRLCSDSHNNSLPISARLESTWKKSTPFFILCKEDGPFFQLIQGKEQK
jgi:hypothetical protein